ncbi:unnamed protein product [Hydatigera taeniaeformis]|uniref:DUF2052 domain-containing protein n=1 Tax=Hydatigena taeniaeformis TaxID=6205 RepID=A0A0R3WMD9_HYDTA|nr:unnamed protein product [Hydatigera taeniaeformis]
MSVNFVIIQLISVAAITIAVPPNPKPSSVARDGTLPLLYGDPTIVGEETEEEEEEEEEEEDDDEEEEGGEDLDHSYLEYLKETFRRGRRNYFGFMDSDELYNAFPLPQPEFLG